jgi:hypothetical protein
MYLCHCSKAENRACAGKTSWQEAKFQLRYSWSASRGKKWGSDFTNCQLARQVIGGSIESFIIFCNRAVPRIFNADIDYD